jgi:hypothetical protein
MPQSFRFLSDDQILKICRLDVHRGSGPGGQKRNKTSNAFRLTHEPTGLHVTATEARSAVENKARAVRRMRLKFATDLREPIEPATFEPPDWFLTIRHPTRIAASHHHEFYAAAGGLILDLLKVMNGNPSHVAAMLGVSTSAVIKFLEDEPQLWAAANRIREEMGMTALTHRR